MNITIKVEADELVQAILHLAESMKTNRPAESVEKPKAKKPTPAPTPEVETPAPAANVTLVQVRARLAELSSEGKKDAIKKLMTDFGVSKLTEVPEEKYTKLMTAAEKL
jgi:hypothetical protein